MARAIETPTNTVLDGKVEEKISQVGGWTLQMNGQG